MNFKHGHISDGKPTKTYRAWRNMRNRCNNPNFKQRKDYAGRGITVCERWNSFENFLEDMGECPEGLTLERKNNDEGYCKNNCKWATYKEQLNNQRSNRILSYDGKQMNVRRWADYTGLPYRTILSRLASGWSVEDALTLPKQK